MKKLVNLALSALNSLGFFLNSIANLLTVDLFENLVSFIILGIIIGGRVGYIFFYNFLYYFNNPIEIFKIWEGGMSFHGALIGIIIATCYFAKIKKLKPLIFLDLIACVSPIGLFFGRIANFINGELYGKPSEVFWAVIFPAVDNIPRHPSQLYEAFSEGVLLFIILIIVITRKNYKSGFCSFLFLILYSLFRFISEQFREPDVHLGYFFNFLSMGSILSIAMFISGFLLILINKKNEI